jgi:hypothetical protein
MAELGRGGGGGGGGGQLGGVGLVRHAGLLPLFAALTTWRTLPMASDPAHLTRLDNDDTAFNTWVVEWVAHQLAHDPLRLTRFSHLQDLHIEFLPVVLLRIRQSAARRTAFRHRADGRLRAPALCSNYTLVLMTTALVAALVVRPAPRHWRPMLNAYSSFAPPVFYELAAKLQAFPDLAVISELRSHGFSHVVLHRAPMEREIGKRRGCAAPASGLGVRPRAGSP